MVGWPAFHDAAGIDFSRLVFFHDAADPRRGQQGDAVWKKQGKTAYGREKEGNLC